MKLPWTRRREERERERSRLAATLAATFGAMIDDVREIREILEPVADDPEEGS